MLEYCEYPPSKALSSLIQCYWMVAPSAENHWNHRMPILPDGCLDIAFMLSGRVKRMGGVNQLFQYAAGVYGIQLQPLLFEPFEDLKVIAVRFRPGGAFPLLRCEVAEFTNQIVSIEDLDHPFLKQLQTKLIDLSENPSATLACLEWELENQIRNELVVPKPLTQAVDHILQSKGRISVEALENQMSFTRQYLNRLFQKYAGASVKQFCRIIRFHSLVKTLGAGAKTNWCELALDHGYYDQSHLSADFKAFSGLSPNAFMGLRIHELNPLTRILI